MARSRSKKNTELLKQAMIKALEQSLGVVTMACKSVGIDRSTHYDWLKNDPEYKIEVEDIENIALDFAESKLHMSIKKGSDTATIFYLKTKGKKRGYVEKTEVDNNVNVVKPIVFDWGEGEDDSANSDTE